MTSRFEIFCLSLVIATMVVPTLTMKLLHATTDDMYSMAIKMAALPVLYFVACLYFWIRPGGSRKFYLLGIVITGILYVIFLSTIK
jgi:hypothetical protein